MEDLELNIRSYLDSTGFKQLEKHVKKARQETMMLNSAAARISQNIGVPFKQVDKYVQQASNSMKRFKMEYLSIMFFGMAIQRTLGGILRASFKTWSEATEGTKAAGGAMTQLQAAWEFFKFSLFDALIGSGVFQWFVDSVLRLVEWWGDLSDSTKSFVADFLLFAAAIGGLMAGWGAIKLGLVGVDKVLSDAGGVKTSLESALGGIAIAYSIVQAVDAFKDFENGKFVDSFINALSAGAMGFGGLRVMKGQKGGAALVAIGVALELVDKGVFFQSLFGFFGQLAGIFKAFSKMLGQILMWGIGQALFGELKVKLETVAQMLQGILPGLAKKIQGVANSLGGLMPSAPTAESFWKDYGEMASWGVEIGKALDEKMQTAINNAQANDVARAAGVASFPDLMRVEVVNTKDFTPVPTYSAASVDDLSRSSTPYYRR